MTQTHTQCKQVEPQSIRPRIRWILWAALTLAAIAVMLLQLVVAPPPGYFAYDEAIWFYPLFGFLCAMALIFIPGISGFILKRRETYWEDKQ